MNVFVPFTNLRCETYLACQGATLVPLKNHEKGYGYYWAERWREGQTFINVEQDVVPAEGVLREMWDCPHDYCRTNYRYPWSGGPIDVSPIGCAKFSDAFIAAHRELVFDGVVWHEPQYQIINASLNLAHLHEPHSLHLHVTEDWPLDMRRAYGVTQDGYRELHFFKR